MALTAVSYHIYLYKFFYIYVHAIFNINVSIHVLHMILHINDKIYDNDNRAILCTRRH